MTSRVDRPVLWSATLLLAVLSVAAPGQAEELRAETVWIPTVESPAARTARQLRLEATLYHPPGRGPFPVLLFNHGSTGNARIAPTMTVRYPEVARFFVERGFAVMVPMRRGRGASEGVYDEAYGCDPARLANGVERGTADVEAAVTFALRQSWADPTRLVLGGMSRGALLSVLYPSVRRLTPRGVINFAGGWTPDWCDGRARFNEQMFARAGRVTLPMLWLYAENDRNYGPSSIHTYHRAFTKSGGAADLRLFPAIGHDGHDLLPRSAAVWQQAVDDFLERIGLLDRHRGARSKE
jgi:dienelactone hydrolase